MPSPFPSAGTRPPPKLLRRTALRGVYKVNTTAPKGKQVGASGQPSSAHGDGFDGRAGGGASQQQQQQQQQQQPLASPSSSSTTYQADLSPRPPTAPQPRSTADGQAAWRSNPAVTPSSDPSQQTGSAAGRAASGYTSNGSQTTGPRSDPSQQMGSPADGRAVSRHEGNGSPATGPSSAGPSQWEGNSAARHAAWKSSNGSSAGPSQWVAGISGAPPAPPRLESLGGRAASSAPYADEPASSGSRLGVPEAAWLQPASAPLEGDRAAQAEMPAASSEEGGPLPLPVKAAMPRRITQVPEDVFVVDDAERAAWAAKVCFLMQHDAYW